MDGAGRKIIFEKYEMGRLLGHGTFAKVYHGRHIDSGVSVAIKIISIEQMRKQGGLMDQVTREISIMKLVRHPNIVELQEVLATKTKIFLIMEYVKGGELFARVAKGKLKEDDARKYFQQLISAIDFCHSRGVSHRDLKPENLLLDENGDLKISDFGLSALPEQLTLDGLLHTRCGTPAYVAPEVLRKKGYDGAKADLWSCGVILYVLLCGFLPFREENIMNMYKKVFKGEFEYPPWITSGSRRLISKLLVTDPNKRITIPAIMRVPWFQKGFSSPNDQKNPVLINEEDQKTLQAPKSYNAFEFISSMSSGFDLSNMFEKKKKVGSMFTSKFSANAIMSKIEGVAKGLSFKVVKGKGFKVGLERFWEGRKGPLAVTAEIFEVAPEVSVVELLKSAGDSMEYDDFCENDARPGLKDIVWTWQGDHCNNEITS